MVFNYYKIYNKITDTIYIGITERSCEKRWKEHVYLLNNNKHPNYLLQNDWNNYKSENFIFDISYVLLSNWNKIDKIKLMI